MSGHAKCKTHYDCLASCLWRIWIWIFWFNNLEKSWTKCWSVNLCCWEKPKALLLIIKFLTRSQKRQSCIKIQENHAAWNQGISCKPQFCEARPDICVRFWTHKEFFFCKIIAPHKTLNIASGRILISWEKRKARKYLVPEKYSGLSIAQVSVLICIVWYIAPKCFSRLDVRTAIFKDRF